MRELITTWLEVAGLVVVSVGAGIEVANYNVGGGVATSGVLLVAASAVVTARTPAKPKRQPEL